LGGTYKLGATILKGPISLSGLHEAEESAVKLGYDEGGADEKTLAEDAGKLLLDAVLAGITLAPGVAGIAKISKGGKLYKTAKAACSIAKMAKVKVLAYLLSLFFLFGGSILIILGILAFFDYPLLLEVIKNAKASADGPALL